MDESTYDVLHKTPPPRAEYDQHAECKKNGTINAYTKAWERLVLLEIRQQPGLLGEDYVRRLSKVNELADKEFKKLRMYGFTINPEIKDGKFDRSSIEEAFAKVDASAWVQTLRYYWESTTNKLRAPHVHGWLECRKDTTPSVVTSEFYRRFSKYCGSCKHIQVVVLTNVEKWKKYCLKEQ